MPTAISAEQEGGRVLTLEPMMAAATMAEPTMAAAPDAVAGAIATSVVVTAAVVDI